MSARRLFRRYMSLSERAAAPPPGSRDDMDMPLGAEAASLGAEAASLGAEAASLASAAQSASPDRSACAAEPASDTPRTPAEPPASESEQAAETDRPCELLELRRQFAGWVH